MEVDHTEEGLSTLNTNDRKLEVAENEDTPTGVEAAASGNDDSCASSCQRNSSSPKCHLIQKLSTAIDQAKHLQFLDLSDNGFPPRAAETFYSSWSSSLRTHSSYRHITDRIIHFSTNEKCCRVKACCKKD